MNSPLITIGITYYQASDTIEKAVLSALKQTWENKEIIIVDDYSNDNTISLLETLQEKHPSIRLIRNLTNKGVAASRNEIIRHANGEFLAFFDDDDESMENRLEQQYERITSYEQKFSNGNPVICYACRIQTYPNGQIRHEQTMGTNKGIAPNGEDVALRILTGKPRPNIFGSTATCSQMARLKTYRDLGFDENFRRSEDTDFNIRAAIQGAHFPGIKEPLVKQTMTLASDKKLIDEKYYTLKLLEKHQEFIKKHTNYQFCCAWIFAKYDCLQKKQISFILQILKLFIMHPTLASQRFWWAIPNTGFNIRFIRFHNEKQ